MNTSTPVVSPTPKGPLCRMDSSAGARGEAGGAHKCDTCGKTFAKPAFLKLHYRRVHGGWLPILLYKILRVIIKYLKVRDRLSASCAAIILLLRVAWSFIGRFIPGRSLTNVWNAMKNSSQAQSYNDTCSFTPKSNLTGVLFVGNLLFNLSNLCFISDRTQVSIFTLFLLQGNV